MGSDLQLPRPAHHATEAFHRGAGRILGEALVILRDRRGVDFTGYRTGTLERRLANRMTSAGVRDPKAYLALLGSSEAEIDRLAANLTIKVSRFYRNASVFEFLRDPVLAELRVRFQGEPLRIWSAGCATGEEAYTLATMCEEQDRVWGTDIDADALDAARRGVFAPESLSETRSELARLHLLVTGAGGRFAVSDRLRDRVTFLRHDLAGPGSAPPPAPFHLICCRNVLIYFAPSLQERVLNLLVDNLVPGGVLCLGEAEWPARLVPPLEIVDRRKKIFRRPAAVKEER